MSTLNVMRCRKKKKIHLMSTMSKKKIETKLKFFRFKLGGTLQLVDIYLMKSFRMEFVYSNL